MNGRIAALCGRVPELTAAQLDGMDAADFAALYAGGVRLLMVKNNETITLHAVDSNGALTWLDTNMPRQNLLDNAGFWIAQAGYGGLHGSDKYAADRWLLFVHEGGSISAQMDSYGILSVAAENRDGSLSQRFEPLDNHKTYTAAFYLADGTLEFAYIQNAGDVSYIQSVIPSGQTRAYKGAALYEGAYNAVTMPPLIFSDPVTELIKCMHYFQVVIGPGTAYKVSDDTISVYGSFKVRMRVLPTLALRVESIDLYSGKDVVFVPTGKINASVTKDAIKFANLSGSFSASVPDGLLKLNSDGILYAISDI